MDVASSMPLIQFVVNWVLACGAERIACHTMATVEVVHPEKERIMMTKTLRNSAWLVLSMAVSIMACAQPDTVLTAKVKASMAVDTSVKASQIEVSTKNKVVTLTGNLDSQAEKDRALEIARKTGGVDSVVDMIEVRSGPESGEAPDPKLSIGEHIDDAGITMAVKTRLLEDPLVKGLRIDVDTREGVVFLTGSVTSPKEIDRAVEIARATEHVRDVKPNLVVSRG
jgi:hyperosmotically inducible protein